MHNKLAVLLLCRGISGNVARNGKYQPMSIMLLVEVRIGNRFKEKITSFSYGSYSDVPSEWDRGYVYSFTSDVTKGRLARLRRQGCRSDRPASARRIQGNPGVGIQFPLRNQRDRIGTNHCSGGDRPWALVNMGLSGVPYTGGRSCSNVCDRKARDMLEK